MMRIGIGFVMSWVGTRPVCGQDATSRLPAWKELPHPRNPHLHGQQVSFHASKKIQLLGSHSAFPSYHRGFSYW